MCAIERVKMTYFPDRPYSDQAAYAQDYFKLFSEAAATVDPSALSRSGEMIGQIVSAGGTIYSCGNGGSAAIANHLVCDCLKGTRADTEIRPCVFSLSTTVELITAIGNDFGYEDVFSYQLESVGKAGDLLIAISSSGSSPNILKALRTARANGMKTLAMVGFDGGAAAQLADVTLWVKADNYGIVEDVHQSLMHIFAQYLRQSSMSNPELLGQRKF
jgi:phosphoheptose isomerase